MKTAPEIFAFTPVIRGENKLEVRNEGADPEIVLIGAIGKSWFDDTGITEQEVRDAMSVIPRGKKFNVRINSEGGSVKEGLGIYNAFKERREDITAHITGYALSIASVFPLGAGKVVSPKSAIWMMHKAWSFNRGNADDMRAAAEMLDAHDETLIDIYAAETGKSKEEIRAAMEKETWIKGKDAVDFGLADETDESDAQAAYRPLDPQFISRCKNIAPEILNAISAAPNKQGAANQPTQKQESEKIMNRAQMLALLKSWGVEINDGLTDDQLVALVSKGKPENKSADNPLAELQAQLANEREARITAAVTRAAENKIANDKLQWWINMALKDEKGTLAQIEALPSAHVGAEPLGPGAIEILDRPVSKNGVQGSKVLPELDNIFAAHKDTTARYNALKMEWPRLLAAAFKKDAGVQASNTFSGTITTNFLIAGAIQKLTNRFAAANLFTRDNSQDPFKPLAVGVMKFNTTATDGSNVVTNATTFESDGDSVISAITITPAQYTSKGHLTNAELNSGFRMGDIVEKKLIDLAAKVTQVITAPITTANFTTNEALVAAPAAFGFSDLATLQGQLKKAPVKNLLLDGEYIARIANTPGFFQSTGLLGGDTGAWRAFGWENIALNTDWSGAGANVRGFAGGPDAIGIISGLPLNPPEGIPGNFVQTGTVMLPDVQIGIATYVWFSAGSRTMYFTYDIILGATLLDEQAGVLIKSA